MLSSSDIVREYDVLNLLQDENFYYLKIKSFIIDNSILHIKIYLSDKEYNYSFHWQKETEELIVRWDNAPHHRDIETFPHHMHTGEMVEESYNITLDDILKEIKHRLDSQKT
ncbi:MAG: hypothetical protein GY940_24815 [bacterium]|nr:hypothetical protein [bacterium]